MADRGQGGEHGVPSDVTGAWVVELSTGRVVRAPSGRGVVVAWYDARQYVLLEGLGTRTTVRIVDAATGAVTTDHLLRAPDGKPLSGPDLVPLTGPAPPGAIVF